MSKEQKERARERLRKWRANLSEEKKKRIREENRARARERYKENPEEHKRQVKESVKKHPEAHREANRRSQRKHPEAHNNAVRKWYKTHPEKKLEKRHKRRIRENGSPGGSFTSYEWKTLCNEYGNICLKCGQGKPLTPDHVIPLALGGPNSIENIQPLCLDCNVRKGIKIADYRKGLPIHVEQLSLALS